MAASGRHEARYVRVTEQRRRTTRVIRSCTKRKLLVGWASRASQPACRVKGSKERYRGVRAKYSGDRVRNENVAFVCVSTNMKQNAIPHGIAMSRSFQENQLHLVGGTRHRFAQGCRC